MFHIKKKGTAEGAGVRVRFLGGKQYKLYRDGEHPVEVDLGELSPGHLVRLVKRHYGSVDDFIYGLDQDDRIYRLLKEAAGIYEPKTRN